MLLRCKRQTFQDLRVEKARFERRGATPFVLKCDRKHCLLVRNGLFSLGHFPEELLRKTMLDKEALRDVAQKLAHLQPRGTLELFDEHYQETPWTRPYNVVVALQPVAVCLAFFKLHKPVRKWTQNLCQGDILFLPAAGRMKVGLHRKNMSLKSLLKTYNNAPEKIINGRKTGRKLITLEDYV